MFFKNDIYHKYKLAFEDPLMKEYTLTVVSPAPDSLVRKYRSSTLHFVYETKEKYLKITKPYIDSIPLKSIQWVYNVLAR